MLKYKNEKNDFSYFGYEILSLIVVIMVLYVYLLNMKGGPYEKTDNIKECCWNTA